MSAIRSFFAKLPRPSVRQATIGAVGATGLSAATYAGVWYFNQTPAERDAAYEKFLQKVGMKKEAQPAAFEEVVKKEADTKPQQAGEEAAGK